MTLQQPFLSRFGLMNLIPARFKANSQKAANLRYVINNEDNRASLHRDTSSGNCGLGVTGSLIINCVLRLTPTDRQAKSGACQKFSNGTVVMIILIVHIVPQSWVASSSTPVRLATTA